jgi:L-amino acid N-acyltransferase
MMIRDARVDDLPDILAVYNDVIATSTAIYTDQPLSLADRRAWFDGRVAAGFPVLVAIEQDRVVGYSSFGEWRSAWVGYRHTVEHSVHIRAGQRGAGHGRELVQALMPRAVAMNMHVMIGAIDAENDASLRFHERLGFTPVAHFREVGR